MKMVFLGPPGAGKGTLAVMAAKRLSLPHVSTGDLFRAAVAQGSELGAKVKDILAAGRLVPDELTVALVRERLEMDDARSGWILDGFPRTIPQAGSLESIDPVDKVVNFDVQDQLIIFRLTGRRVCASCGAIYHVVTLPPKAPDVCDACGGKLRTRADDKEESIKVRLSAYREQTAPLIDWYREKGCLITIDAAGTPEAVYERFAAALGL